MKEEELISLLMVSDHTHLFVLVTDPVMRFLGATKKIRIMSCITPAILGK